jgi:hypothetical protein
MTVCRRVLVPAMIALMCAWLTPNDAAAAEAAQGSFDVTLDESFVCSTEGGGGGFVAHHTYDDKTFQIPLPPGNNVLTINFSLIGNVTFGGAIDCVFDDGGTFSAYGDNDAGDFHWIDMTGEYLDRKPGISEGDPFPFVGTAQCTTTRTDDFKTLCDNFEFSFNGLGKALPPNPWYKDYNGDFTFRAVKRAEVGSGPTVNVHAAIDDGSTGDIPAVQVRFQNGVNAPGLLRVATLADAWGAFPRGVDFPVRGTTAVDHGAGGDPDRFFPGGDERFVEIETDAVLPGSPAIEVCLPMPATADPSAIRPVRVLHGEGSGMADRKFVDRTSQVDPTSHQACAKVKSFSKFVLVTTDVCGGGQTQSNGLLTVAGGLVGKRTVVVDGLTDCAAYPSNLPRGLAKYCVPDANPTTGQCGVSISLGINRAGCNRSDQNSSYVDVNSYSGVISHGSSWQDLGPVFGNLIKNLSSPVEATVGPVDVSVPVGGRLTTYTLKHQLAGWRPQTSQLETDKDVLKIRCLDPTQF